MDEKTYLTPEERLTELSDSLIVSIMHSDDISLANRRFLFGQLSPVVFRDENYVIYHSFYSFREKNITLDADFLKMYLMRNKKFLKESSHYINLSEFKDLAEDEYVAYISATIAKFERLSKLEPMSIEEFNLAVEKYKQEYSAHEANTIFSKGKMVLYDGVQEGRRFYQGYDDAVAYVKNKLAMIESVLDKTKGAGFIDSRTEAVTENDDELKPEKIGDFDLLGSLTETFGGIYTTMFYNILAPTKSGKSKFTTRMAHTVMVQYGNNITVWAHEGGYKAWWAQLRSIHFEYLYIRNKSDSERIAPLSQKDILYGNYPSPEIEELERNSRLDLFTNPKYGVCNMIERPFEVETFIEEIDTSVKLNNSKFVLVDYLQLIESTTMTKKSEFIGKAYQRALNYCKKAGVGFASPSQFKQEVMNDLLKDKGGSADVRTFGGESSEIVRTPDINIVLWASVEDLIRKEMTIKSIPSRFCEAFPDISIYADLSCCVFSDIEE